MKRPFAVIFDMDGVLIDSEPIHYESETLIFKRLNIEIFEDERHTFIGSSPRAMWQTIKDKFALPPTVDELLKYEQSVKREFFETIPIPLVPGAIDLIYLIENTGIPMAIASSSRRDVIDLFTQKTDIAKHFREIVSGFEVENGKPAPDIYIEAAKRLSFKPEDCVAVEDSTNGILAAKTAGLKCIGFRNPYSKGQDISKADMTIDRLNDLSIDAIRSLFQDARCNFQQY